MEQKKRKIPVEKFSLKKSTGSLEYRGPDLQYTQIILGILEGVRLWKTFYITLNGLDRFFL